MAGLISATDYLCGSEKSTDFREEDLERSLLPTFRPSNIDGEGHGCKLESYQRVEIDQVTAPLVIPKFSSTVQTSKRSLATFTGCIDRIYNLPPYQIREKRAPA